MATIFISYQRAADNLPDSWKQTFVSSDIDDRIRNIRGFLESKHNKQLFRYFEHKNFDTTFHSSVAEWIQEYVALFHLQLDPAEAPTDFERICTWFLQDDGARLKQYIGDSDLTGKVLDVIKEDLPVNELPDPVREEVEELKNEQILDDHIFLVIVLLWLISIVWTFHDRSFDAATNLVAQLLAILYFFKETSS